MSQIKAIETVYKGYRFRSRLEARWAVFFDALGYEWKYEPEGFELDDGSGDLYRYLPDFYLPDSETWVEVKGSDALLGNDKDRLEMILDYNSPIPGISDSDNGEVIYGHARGLLILGEIPDPTQFGLNLHRIVRHDKGLWFRWAFFGPHHVNVIPDWFCDWFFDNDGVEDWTCQSKLCRVQRAYPDVLKAYGSARSARFEHGENGAPRTF